MGVIASRTLETQELAAGPAVAELLLGALVVEELEEDVFDDEADAGDELLLDAVVEVVDAVDELAPSSPESVPHPTRARTAMLAAARVRCGARLDMSCRLPAAGRASRLLSLRQG